MKKDNQCWLEIIVLLLAIFFIFVITVITYEKRIDELEEYIVELKEQCVIK